MSIRYPGNPVRFEEALSEIFTREAGNRSFADQYNGALSFCADPDHYIWRYIGRQNMHVPFKRSPVREGEDGHFLRQALLGGQVTGWELHPVWIVEGRLRRGESNVLYRRRFYIDESTRLIIFGEGFDPVDNMTKCYLLESGLAWVARMTGKWYNL